jgi:hypothetical protein
VSEYIEQFWRDATADDVARVMSGELIEARFRDFDSEEWGTKILLGYLGCGPLGCNWIDMGGVGWKLCQVYAPPAWFLNKPDPGEGYRLLEKFPPESPQEGDEFYCFGDKAWHTSLNVLTNCSTQAHELWYRRRIETNSPAILDSSTAENTSEAPHGSRSRNTIPRGWRLLGKDEDRLASDAYWSLGCKDWIVIGDDRVAIANELPRWHAIRQVGCLDLIEGFSYTLPSGKMVWVTAKGFEVG